MSAPALARQHLCPSCSGDNYARTPGNIVSARAPNLVA
jgi:hypothetical protein